ncbi:MAG: sensor domain-containing diguanylate cyclase [Psychrilyobacter sp.]|uniref:sensor domain-containing diguanylate cyclase n=1 Tax=Psychrilyobacter sp. TaxID=2586924 RepID=UPI003C791F39
MENLTMNMKAVLNNLYDAVYIVDTNRKMIYWNKAAEDLTGYSSSDVIGSHCFDNILNHIDSNGTQLCKNCCPLMAAIKDDEIKEANVFFHHKNGHRIPIFVKAFPYKDSNGVIIGAIEIFSEISERKQILEKIKNLSQLAMLDELTKIPNRRYTENVIKIKLNEYSLNKINFALVFIDIDNFKHINDNYGHDVGDMVLKAISKTFLNNLSGDDVIGRWGGDEFLAAFSGIEEEGLKMVTEKLRMLVENTVVDIKGEHLKVTISIGAVLVTPEDDLSTLIKKSDTLLYKSKKNGKNCISIG